MINHKGNSPLLPCCISLNAADEWLPLLLNDREVPSSYLCLRTEYTEPSRGFPQSFQANLGTVPQICGRAITQVVSGRLPTSVPWVQSQGNTCGMCGERSGTATDFPYQFSSHKMIHFSHLSPGAGKMGPLAV
jgi:hypothetical protein